MIFEIILIIYFSYLLGSIPTGILVSRLFNLGELKSIGSGNIGATNVLRTGNFSAAGITLFVDFFKALIPITLTLAINDNLLFISGTFILLGHIFPIWLDDLKGGKGYASFMGIIFAVNFYLFLALGVSWVIIFVIYRYSSLASLLSANLISLISLFYFDFNVSFMCLIINLIMIFSHHENIKRLLKREEKKLY